MAFNDFMHERNIYKERPDFRQIALDYPELRKYAIPNDRGKIHVDFTNPEGLRTVTKILLKKDFNLSVEIPNGFLIPTVPQRLNYILWIEDILNAFQKENETTSGIDVGTGPCAIFSLLGAQKNAWKFLSTDTSDEAIYWAEKNIKANKLESKIKVIKVCKDSVLKEVLSSNNDEYDFCLCNPPFFDNIEEIRRKHPRVKETLPEITKESEILSEGGEVAFVRRMIEDSIAYKNRIRLYTSMFGKKKSFLQILKELEGMNDVIYTKTEFCQGNTVRWGIAWTFLKGIKFIELKKPKPPKHLKAKPPLTLQIPIEKGTTSCTVKILLQKLQGILHEFEIQFKIMKSYENFAEMQITTDKNTWSNLRRKRRQLMQDKNKKESTSVVTENVSASLISANEDIKTELAQSTEKLTGVTDPLNSDKAVTDPLAEESSTDAALGNSKKCKVDEDNLDVCKRAKSESNESPTRSKQDSKPSIDSFQPCSLDSSSIDSSKKRKLDEDNLESCKRVKLESSESSNESKQDSKPSIDSFQPCSLDSSSIDSSKKRKLDEDNLESCKRVKLESSESSNENKQDSKSNKDSFQRCSLLYGILKLIKCKNHISLELNCPPDANRETMHQIFQLFKNKFV